MSQVHYIATFAFVDAICHMDFMCECFKLIKNGKAVRRKLNLFLETVSNPSILTDIEINDFLQVFSVEKWNFFKNTMNQPLKQKLTGFMIRGNCSERFCDKLTNSQLQKVSFTQSMIRLNNMLLEVFKPVVIVLTMSPKSKSNEQISSFANLSSEDFHVVRNNRIELSRKMNKFEVWLVNEKDQRSLCERIQNETVPWPNSLNSCKDSLQCYSANSMPTSSNSSNDLVEYVRSFSEY